MTADQSLVQRERDPVCGMNVRVDVAIEDGLTADHDGHTSYFCRAGCRDEFLAGPERYVNSHTHAAEAASAGTPSIDDGMRRWYESCSCCLSDAYPDVKAVLDAERAAAEESPVAPGICEVAEGAEAEAPARP